MRKKEQMIMEETMKDVKINVRSLITSSYRPLSVQQLIKDYEASEGKPIPYKRLGFNSVVELLQSFKDTLILPENPNKDSILSLIVSEKTQDLRLMVEKQKSDSKKRKNKSSCNNSIHSNSPPSTNGYSRGNHRNYNRQSNGNNFSHRYNISPKNQDQNKIHNTGHVTYELRQYLERAINNSKMDFTVSQLTKSIKEHQDFPLLNAKKFEDAKRLLSSFLEIKGNYVFLKSTVNIENQNGFNNDSKSSTNSLSYRNTINPSETLADLEILEVTNLLSKLKTNDDHEDMNYNYKTLTTQSVKTDSNSNEIKNHLQRISENSINNVNSKFCHSTTKNQCIENTENDKSSSVCQNQRIPKEVLFNITRIFNVYNKGLNADNYELLYNILYDNIFDSISYGFETIIQLFKALDQIVEVKNNVFYKKNENKLDDHVNFKHHNVRDKQENISRILSEIKFVDISLHVHQKLLCSDQNSSKTKVILADVYNPSLFYLHTDDTELFCLMDQMKLFYDENNEKYNVKSEHIFAGLIYVSSYTSFSNEKQWFRVKVLGEVDSDIVKVIHVDFGTVDFIPKTELKFLNKEFSNLPCQAIRCCLTSYNELDSIKPEVTNIFLEFTNKKPFFVQIDTIFTFESFCDSYQILHVTLFEQISGSEMYININNELSKVF